MTFLTAHVHAMLLLMRLPFDEVIMDTCSVARTINEGVGRGDIHILVFKYHKNNLFPKKLLYNIVKKVKVGFSCFPIG
jgi:hypothetical protein